MAFGLDYISGPPISALQSAGVTFVCRYLSYVNELTKVKLLTSDEARALSQAGIAIVSNYEWYANRALEAAASGIQDAQIAASQHAQCGGPANRPIYFSVDADVPGAATADYFKGVASAIGLSRTGAYGSYRVLKYLFDQGLISWGWQTYAWSGGAWEPRAHIQQYQNGVTIAGVSVDYDRSIKADFGQWLQGGNMQLYTPQSADFGTWFTATDVDHWTCKQTTCVIQYGIRGVYSRLSLDGQSLPVIGLPVTNEIYVSQALVLQVYERGAIWWDTSGGHNQPGASGWGLSFLRDSEMLKNVPGLTLPTASVDTTALLAAINEIPNSIAPAVAAALIEVKKL